MLDYSIISNPFFLILVHIHDHITPAKELLRGLDDLVKKG